MKQIFKINNSEVQSTATADPLAGRQKHKHYRTTTATTGLACRALLVLALLMGWGSKVLADERVTILNVTSGNGDYSSIDYSAFGSYDDSYTIELSYHNTQSQAINNWGIGKLGAKNAADSGQEIHAPADAPANSDFVVTYTVGQFKTVAGTSGGVQFRVWNANLLSVVVIVPVTDSFVNTWRGNTNETTNSKEIERTTLTATVDYTDKSAKYARIYVTNATGSKQNSWDTNLLEVTYNGIAATQGGSSNTNGVYVSDANGINFDNLSVTLKTGAGNFKNYKVVTILSNDAMTGTQEPAWDEQYTYSYTYPAYEQRFDLDESILNQTMVEIDNSSYYRDLILTHYGKTANQIKDNWYGRWYVTDESGNRQNLALGTANGTNWVITPRNENEGQNWNIWSWSVADNIAYTNEEGRKNDWFVNQSLCRGRIYAPSSSTFQDYGGYKLVFEATDNYTSGTPNINVRFIFSIPSTVVFEGEANTGAVADATGTQKVNAAAASVNLDLTNKALAHSKVASADIKYARFYLTDAEGTIVDPTGKLTVKYNGTTISANCPKANQGFYVYDNGNTLDKTKFEVTLTTPNAYTDYKVVALFAVDPLQNIVESSGTVSEEPDYDLKYTYSFANIEFEYSGTVTNTPITQQFANATDDDTTVTLDWSLIDNLPLGIKYARFYVLDASGNAVDASDAAHLLTVSNGTLCDNHTNGYYVYTGSDLTLGNVTLTSNGGSVLPYRVVCWIATSETGIYKDGNTVLEEPDITNGYVYSFRKPVQHTEKTGTVEWSPVSMTVPLDIDAHKGSGYLASLGTNYHVVWTVSVGGAETTPATGSARQAGQWTMSLDGNNATFYAPAGQTFADMSNVTFVARLYETATGENDADKSLTYTVSIDRTEFLGLHKSTFTSGTHTIIIDAATTIPVTVPLSNATKAFSGAKYARVWLTQGGTAVNPSGKLALPTGMTAFGTKHDATLGYYLYNESGITLSDVTLTLAALSDYPGYQVHIALSADAPIGIADFARADAPRRAPSLSAYEPDYDYEYTISFQDSSMKVIKIYVQASENTTSQNASEHRGNNYTTTFQTQVENAFTEMGQTLTAANCFVKWDILDENGAYVTLKRYYAGPGQIQLGGVNPYHANDTEEGTPTIVWAYNGANENNEVASMLNTTLTFGNGVFQLGKVIELWVTNENNQTAADPANGYKVKVEVHFNEDGNPPYTFLNETAIAATKQMVDIGTLDATTPEFDMAEALVSGAKYARFYLTRYGSAAAASNTLTVTYDGTAATACADPYGRYGFYISDANGIDLAKLTVGTSLTPDGLMSYQLVVVSSSEALTGEQEPAWQKKHQISFQKVIRRRIMASATNTSVTNDDLAIGANSLQADVLANLNAAIGDISGTLYARWYVLAPGGTTLQMVAGRNGAYGGNSTWGFNLDGNGNGQWQNIDNAYTLYTDMNGNVTSQTIAQNDDNGLWNSQIARATAIYVPRPGNEETHTLEYAGYRIVFEISDEYDPATNGTSPGFRLRYVYTLVDPADFVGNPKIGSAEGAVTQTVNRSAESVTLTLRQQPPAGPGATSNWALDHASLRGPQNHPRYARFYLIDLDGNAVDPTGKLTVTYGGNNATVTTCTTPEHGFYIASTNNGELQRERISVSLAAPGEYMLYKVVCIFSKNFDNAAPDPLSIPLQREPDYDLKYTYSFDYNVTTATFNRTIDWKNNEPMNVLADLPNSDPEQDWNISWAELSASQYVSWYVINNQNQRQPVAIGNSRQDNTWTLDLRGLPFEVVSNTAAVATGQTVSANSWHSWGRPDLYAPTGMTYEQGQNYSLVCEVAATADATPYARYNFGFVNNILGELKTTGTRGEEIIRVEETATAVTVPLQNAVDEYRKEHPDAKVIYVRAWLTTTDGTMVNPSPLSWSQMYIGYNQVVPFRFHNNNFLNRNWTNYGYYWCSADIGEHNTGIDPLNNATLTLAAGTHPQYEVHVALSTSNPTEIAWQDARNRWEFSNATTGGGGWPWGWLTGDPVAHEPDYDYVYTFKFRTAFEATNINSPELKTKYKTLIYDPASNSCTPTILHNWPEVVADVTSNRLDFAAKAYVRWYLVDKATNEPIEMLDFEAQAPYVSLGNEYGYYFRNFDVNNLPYRDNQHHEYDPTITLPADKTYNDVRVVCVVTTLTDDIAESPDVLSKEPRQMQVKYIYDLMTEPQLAAQPFIHYHGIHYPLYHRSFEDSREFIGPGQPQDLPDVRTAATDLIQRVWDYGKNAIYDPADNSYAAGRTYNKSHNGPQVDPNDAASLLANSPDYSTRNIRQKVHTKEYNYYLLLEPGQQETLKLPFQEYLGGGNDTEPMGYIRWYDWKTDKNHSCLVRHSETESLLTQLMSTEADGNQVDRGWYKIMTGANPTVNNIGIDFKAPDNFNSDSYEEIVIACDVSRYMDGLDDSKRYLVHEPTLSIRYVYHILPAKRVADQMVAGATKFNSVISTLEGLQPGQAMTFADIPDYDKTFHLMEYNGRTVVSVMGSGDATKPAQGNFSLRTSLTEIDHYYVYVNGELKPCNNLQWYAYYEYEGRLYRRMVPMVKGSTAGNAWTDAVSSISEQKYTADYHREDARLAIFETKDFWGEYERVRDPNEKMTFNIQPGQFLHLVGCLGYDDGTTITEVPTVSTEFFIVDAAPKPLGSEGIERTDYTLSSQYKKAAELNFDDFFDDPNTRYDKPLTSFDNYAKIPMLFADAQYGFCYPRLYGQCATDWHLLTAPSWDGFGFAPLHGDYTLLKSMNMPGISTTRGDGDEVNTALNSQSMYALWYEHGPLYDVTHERASQKATDDTKDYGSFLYVDAAEQARTIGRLEFDAQLCAGAEIYFTAYIADMTDAVRYGTSIPNTTPQVRFRVYTYNTDTGYPVGTVVDGYTTKLLPGYESSATMPVISFLTGDIATEGATDKAKWYQVYGYSNLPPEDRTFLEGDSRHYYVEVDNYCENTYGADYAVDQITFYTNSARVRIAQASDICDDEKGVKLRISALASALLPHFGQGQDREIFYRIYPYSDDPNKTGLEADEAITGQNVYCHEEAVDDGDRGNLYGAVPFHVGYDDAYASDYNHTLYNSLDELLATYAGQPEYKPRYGFYKEGDEVYYLLDERYFELKAGQEYFVSLYTLGSYKPGGLDGWGNPYGNHTCTAYSNTIMPRNMYIQLTEANEPSDGIVDFSCSRTESDKEFGVRVRYPLESGGYQDFTDLEFDFFLGTKSQLDECYLTEIVDGVEVPVTRTITNQQDHEEQVPVMLKDALAHFRGLKNSDDTYKYAGAFTTVPTEYANEDGVDGKFYQVLKKYVEKQSEDDKPLLRLDFNSKFINHFVVDNALTEGIHEYYLALPVYPQIDEDKEICSPITMDFYLDPSGGAPLLELGFDDVKYPADYTKRGVRLGLEQIAKMRDDGYMLHIPISNYHEKNHEKRLEAEPDRTPNTLYFENAVLKLSATNDPEYLDAEGNITQTATQLIVTEIQAPGAAGSSNENDNGEGVYVNNNRMYLPLSFKHDTTDPDKKYVNFKEGYWYEVNTRYYDAGDVTEYSGNVAAYCYADLFIVFKVVPEFATWDAQPIGSTHLHNVSWHNDGNWKRSVRSDLYKDANGETATQNTPTAGHPGGYFNDGEGEDEDEGTLNKLTGPIYEANPNPGFVPMKFTYVTLLTGNHAPSLINEARSTTGAVQTGGFLIDPNQTELMTDTSPVDNKESSSATSNIRYDMVVRYGDHAHGGEGCFGHRSKSKGTDGKWGWRNDKRTDMTSFNETYKAFDVEKFYGNICKEIYFKPEAELLRQQRLTYEKAWVEKELVANRWYLVSSPLKSTYAGDMYVPTSMTDVTLDPTAAVRGRQVTEAFQPISFSTEAVSADRTAETPRTSQPAYSRTKYPVYQRSWKNAGSKVWTKENDTRATDYSANLDYQSVSTDFLEWSHTYNDVQVPYSTATEYGDGNTVSQVSVPMGFSVRAHRKVQKDGSSNDVPALIRLPKADVTYQYYDWSDAGSTPAGGEQTETVSKPQAQLTNTINGTTWNYKQPMQYRFITDDASTERATQGAMEFNISDLQEQDGYVLVGNPAVSSLNMGEFFNGNDGLMHTATGENTMRYSYWTYEGGQAKAYLLDRKTTTHTVTVDGNTTQEQVITYTISSDGSDPVGIIRPMQAFFVKKNTADKIYFTRNMGIDGNFPVNDSNSSGTGNGDGGTGVEPGPDGGSRPFGVTLRAVCGQGGSSATVRVNDTAGDDFAEGEDVETLFDSNLADVPMVYTVAGGQAVSIDQRPQLDLVSFGVVQAKDEPVEVTVTTQHASPTTQQLYFIDALTGEQTPLADGSKVTVQPNDYGRYFISATTGVQSKTDIEHGIVISVRQQEVTVTVMGGQLSKVSATTLGGIKAFNSRGSLDTQCRFKLAKGVYIIQASTTNGQQRQLKVVVE